MNTVEKIAKYVYEAEQNYLKTLGKPTTSWAEVSEKVKATRVNLIKLIVETGIRDPVEAHKVWKDAKIKEGWQLGPTLDIKNKKHPFLRPYQELPKEHQIKDYLLFNTVSSCLGIVKDDL